MKSDEQLSQAELQSVENTQPAPSGEPWERFIQASIAWANDWIQANESALANGHIPANQALLFVYSEAPELERTAFEDLGSDNVELFWRAVSQDSQGVVLCSENLHQMIRISPGFASIDNAFTAAIAHLKSEHTFVLLSLAQRRMFVHRKGEKMSVWRHSVTPTELRFLVTPLSAARIEQDIATYHDRHLRLPGSSIAQMLWKGRDHPYQMHPSPEQRIQGYLLTELQAGYRHLRAIVDEETRGRAGRCDLRVAWPVTAGPHPYVTTMLELKVLREGEGVLKHRRWMLSGIKQADSYRQADTEAVYACVFDARKDKSDPMVYFDKVADNKDVRLRRYALEAPVAPARSTKPKAKSKKAASVPATKSPKKASGKRPKTTTPRSKKP